MNHGVLFLPQKYQILVPSVVNKDCSSWIEWKQFVAVSGDGETYSVGISLRFKQCQWKIECLDYDAGRIFEQHRLISDELGMPNMGHLQQYQWAYSDIIGRVTAKLNITSKVCHGVMFQSVLIF